MPRYRFVLPVRAVGGYRLPEGGLAAEGVTLTPAVDPAYTARVDNVQADNVVLAYELAQGLVEHFFGYLALLGAAARCWTPMGASADPELSSSTTSKALSSLARIG